MLPCHVKADEFDCRVDFTKKWVPSSKIKKKWFNIFGKEDEQIPFTVNSLIISLVL